MTATTLHDRRGDAQVTAAPSATPSAPTTASPSTTGGATRSANPATAAEGERVEVISNEDPLEDPRAAQPFVIWAAPALTIIDAAQLLLTIPVGVNIPLSKRVSLMVDASIEAHRREAVFAPNVPLSSDPFFGSEGGVGISWNILRDSRSTPFVTPKLGYAIRTVSELFTPASGASFRRDELEFQLGPGLDVGWQFHAYHISAAVLFGISATYCWNCVFMVPRSSSDPTLVATRNNGILPLFNFEIVRVGVTF